VANDSNVVAGGTSKRTAVGSFVLDVGQDGTFGDGSEREDVADGKGGVLSGIDELGQVSTLSFSPFLLCVSTNLASVHALVGDEGLGVVLEPVWL
jgi:hypothetical protein